MSNPDARQRSPPRPHRLADASGTPVRIGMRGAPPMHPHGTGSRPAPRARRRDHAAALPARRDGRRAVPTTALRQRGEGMIPRRGCADPDRPPAPVKLSDLLLALLLAL